MTNTEKPEVNGLVTSQTSATCSHLANGTNTSATTTSCDSTQLAATKPRPPEVKNGHVTSQPETQTIDVGIFAKPEAVDQPDMARDATTGFRMTPPSEVTSQQREMTSESGGGRVVARRENTTRNDKQLHVDDIGENYDSDDDEPDLMKGQGQVRGGAAVWRKKRGGRLFEDDGAGYVYVFTDTVQGESGGGGACRVKVSGSRRPDARLRQAQLFNVDMRLLTAVRVGRRLAAACRLRDSLIDSAIAGTLDWFNTTLDDVITRVMDLPRQFPPPDTELQ